MSRPPPRLYAPPPLPQGESLALGADEARHAGVLRLRVGDAVRLFDGCGGVAAATVVRAGKGGWAVRVDAVLDEPLRESGLHLTVAQGLARGARMDEVIRHGTELGVAVFVPLLCERSTRRSGNVARWRLLARDGARQCGRAVVPEVREVMSLRSWLAERPSGWRGVLGAPERGAARPLPAALPDECARASLLVGPEGGLAPEELEAARDAGFEVVSMGSRTLRTETAALAAVASLHALVGDWSRRRC